jgi:hypothetical protein
MATSRRRLGPVPWVLAMRTDGWPAMSGVFEMGKRREPRAAERRPGLTVQRFCDSRADGQRML